LTVPWPVASEFVAAESRPALRLMTGATSTATTTTGSATSTRPSSNSSPPS